MSPELMKLIEQGGPIGLAMMVFYFWKVERADKIHYRDVQDKYIDEVPKLTMALERLTDEVARRNKESFPPRAE